MPIPGPACPYCHGNPSSTLRDASVVYGEDYAGRFSLWVCVNFPECDTYVGIHKDRPGAVPLGTMANAALRKLRKKCHSVFDEQWQSGRMTRSKAYRNLDRMMGMGKGRAHFGEFSEDQCFHALMILSPAPEERRIA